MAAMRLGGEKPHQGLPGRNPALYQGSTVCNSTTALGLRGQAELNRVGSCSTGKERDTESGNDYFSARYYASSMGRFLSPDWSAKQDPVPYARLDNPQTLNLYAYLRNNPLGGVDADGHCKPGDPQCGDVQIKTEVQKVDPQTSKPTPPGVVDHETQPDGTVKSGARGIVSNTVTVNGQPLTNTPVDEKNDNKLVIDGKQINAPTDQGPSHTNEEGKLGDVVGPLFTPSANPADDKFLMDTFKNSAVTMTSIQTLTFTLPGGASCSATATRTLTNGSGGTYTFDPGHYDIKPVTPNQ